MKRNLWTLLCLSVAVTAPATATTAADEPARYPVPAECMRAEQGHCTIATMDFGEEGDKFTGHQSGLILYEDGKPLGPARSAHAQVRELGGGRYSHWTREALYFSASDNSDPRTDGRRYEVASTNPRSTLGGLDRFPAVDKQHVEWIRSPRHEYTVAMGGTLDMDNTRTLTTNNCYVAFQNNVALEIENVGETPVVNPRLVINDRGNWYTFESLLKEFTRGATSDEQKAYRIWQNMRQNLYHETPLFGNAEPHDPVKLFNIFGFNLCDDAGNSGCSLFDHAGLTGSKNRSLHGHVQCEALVDGNFQFLDVDMDCFYLDRENRLPVGGDRCAHDHDLVRRELNYGPVVSGFTSSDGPAALFGSDDTQHDARLRGHEMAYTLRPSEKVIFRWDNIGKYPAENAERVHRPKYFGNSKFVFTPRLTLEAVRTEASAFQDLVELPANAADRLSKDANVGHISNLPGAADATSAVWKRAPRLAGHSEEAFLAYAIQVPYTICGGTVRAKFLSSQDQVPIALSLDGQHWIPLTSQAQRSAAQENPIALAPDGAKAQEIVVSLDTALDVHNKPAKHGYFVRVGLGASESTPAPSLISLEIETDVLAAPVSLPRLSVGTNQAVYWDQTEGDRRVCITHRWRESDAVQPLPPVATPTYPPPSTEIRNSIINFSWPALPDADRYHLQVSRRADFAYPYRPSFDVIVPTTRWAVPYTGVFSPQTTYYWRLRCRDQWGVWGPWSEPWTFTWRGPCVPIDLRFDQQGPTITLHWKPNLRGERPAVYEVFGSDERGFSVHSDVHNVPGLGHVPGNFLVKTTETSLVVVSPTAAAPTANKVYYRVVAVDAHGTRSGCSDYAELPHPFVYTEPVTEAAVGQRYEYSACSLHSLGDYQCRQDPSVKYKKYAHRFWDIEQSTFQLLEAPAWLTVNKETGTLSGTPTSHDAGTSTVRLQVTNQLGAQTTQRFPLTVSPRPNRN